MLVHLDQARQCAKADVMLMPPLNLSYIFWPVIIGRRMAQDVRLLLGPLHAVRGEVGRLAGVPVLRHADVL